MKWERQLDGNDDRELGNLWMPGTLTSQVQQVGEQFTGLTERNRWSEMAQQSETSTMEKMLQMMLTMRQEDQRVRQEEKREE